MLIKSLSKKTIFFLLTFLCLQLVAVNEKDDFVYDLSLATQGISVSQYNTGVNYSIGRGINKDVEKAVYWYQRANEQGHSKAPFNIAIFYVDGINTDPDPELALEYFLVAEERGNKHAKEFLDKLRRADNPDLREALLKFCCPEPLSHSMIPKN